MFGRHHSEETRLKMSHIAKARYKRWMEMQPMSIEDFLNSSQGRELMEIIVKGVIVKLLCEERVGK